MAVRKAEHDLIGVVYAAPRRVHGVGIAVFVIGADNQHRHGIQPGFGSEILTHNQNLLFVSHYLSKMTLNMG